MKQSARLLVALILTSLFTWAASPRVTGVKPSGGHTGDKLVVAGENLGADSVTRFFLTDGTNDHRVVMEEQKAGSILFAIPEKVEPGYYRLMLQTAGPTPALLEQPVSCQVLAADEELPEEEESELEIVEPESEPLPGEKKKK
jgi:hypothetical protein